MNRAKDIGREERELLTQLRARPGIYLGNDVSLTELWRFLHGYEIALRRHSLTDARLLPEGFQRFVEDQFHIRHDSPRGWWTIICQHQPDESKALACFWKLLNACLLESGCEVIPEPPSPPEDPPIPDGIRRVRKAMLPELARSYMRTFNGAPWWDRWTEDAALGRLNDLYDAPGSYGIAMFRGGDPVGALLGRSERYFNRKAFQITELWVETAVQHQGIGKALLDLLKSEKEDERFYLITTPGEAAEGFYEKNGFVIQEGLCVMQLPQQ